MSGTFTLTSTPPTHRYYSTTRSYTEMGYTFLYQQGVNISLPVDRGMWLYLLGKAQKWGLRMYEQDWLNVVWQGIPAQTKGNITAANDWLSAMTGAVEELGLEMQFCMPLPNHILFSTTAQAVSNARASGDYHPAQDNWKIGLSSLFYWSVGVAPSKDDLWTTEVQPGSPYGDKPTEPNWQLQAIVVTLSTGPNGPSDMLGGANATLIRSTINGDGFTLKPDRPAVTVQGALSVAFDDAPVAEVRATWSAPGGGALRWHYVLAAELGSPFTLASGDLGPPTGGVAAYAVFDWFNPSAGPVATLPAAGGTFIIPAGQGQPSAPSHAVPIRYYVAAPVLPGGWVLYGEAGKVVPASRLRWTGLQAGAGGFTATLAGAGGEGATLSVLVGAPGAAAGLTPVACPTGAGVVATLTCATGAGCACK